MAIEADEGTRRIDGRSREAREARAAALESGRAPLRDPKTLRPDTRADSVKEAEEYARQIMEEIGTDVTSLDEFHLDAYEIPEGWEYQWKRIEVLGKEDRGHHLEMMRNKWRPVQASRHPHMMPHGHEGAIIIKGLMLCEIPKSVADTRRKIESREARDVLKNAEAQLYDTPANTAPRDDPSVLSRGLNKVTRDYVRPEGAVSADAVNAE